MIKRFNERLERINALYEKKAFLEKAKETMDQNLAKELISDAMNRLSNYQMEEISLSKEAREEILSEAFENLPKAYEQNLEDYLEYIKTEIEKEREYVLGENGEKVIYQLQEEKDLAKEGFENDYLKWSESLLSFLESDQYSYTAYGDTPKELLDQKVEMAEMTIDAANHLEKMGIGIKSEQLEEKIASHLADIYEIKGIEEKDFEEKMQELKEYCLEHTGESLKEVFEKEEELEI